MKRGRPVAGPVGELLRNFDAGHRQTYESPYLASFKRDVHLLKELLEVYSPAFANELMSAFWLAQKRARRDDSYIIGHSRPDVRGFRASIPNLIRSFEFDTPPAQRGAVEAADIGIATQSDFGRHFAEEVAPVAREAVRCINCNAPMAAGAVKCYGCDTDDGGDERGKQHQGIG